MWLLDTCALLWLVADQRKLSVRVRTILTPSDVKTFVSAISAFEIAIKHRRGALKLPLSPELWYGEALDFHGIREIPVTGTIAAASALLPPIHGDPCDRMIVATAQAEGLTVLTPDEKIRAYEVRAIW